MTTFLRARPHALGALVLLSVLGACVSSHVLVGTPRPPTTPDQVKLYLRPPAKFEEIALLDASSRRSLRFTSQSKTDKAIERLKNEAAKLGANGILLQGVTSEQVGSLGTGVGSASASGNSAYGGGIGLGTGLYANVAKGVAIFVTQE